MRLLLDEMYSPMLAETLRSAGIDARVAVELGLAGQSDDELFAAAVAEGLTVLTETVADFARIASTQVASGRHHPGLLIALSTRFSRRPSGITTLAAAILAVARDPLEDRTVYLRRS